MVLFHGTSTLCFNLIKVQGLRPGCLSVVSDYQTSPEVVYLARWRDNPSGESAFFYGKRAARGKDAFCVLHIDASMLDESRLLPASGFLLKHLIAEGTYPQLVQANQTLIYLAALGSPNAYFEGRKIIISKINDLLPEYRHLWRASWEGGEVAYRGVIPPECFTKIEVVSSRANR